ncbi:hypothetical protein M409DRAFT_61599 [Zasmidium cellare ATCC 36951]|uniref:Uncharacterized protein n=1 Tax=Zasmidium cellare ATCC 36951 TaxID=1080233 RepID=A0A6A6BYL1_ZASCE|nr:uncharacterized protein M409DRAFT_61599 [Zasmidium cellare ATCC 36951]KAF2158496.1 hypothetical protein M409DRAFT_61599 [Zasmidium cellare ATCC 36951]
MLAISSSSSSTRQGCWLDEPLARDGPQKTEEQLAGLPYDCVSEPAPGDEDLHCISPSRGDSKVPESDPVFSKSQIRRRREVMMLSCRGWKEEDPPHGVDGVRRDLSMLQTAQ